VIRNNSFKCFFYWRFCFRGLTFFVAGCIVQYRGGIFCTTCRWEGPCKCLTPTQFKKTKKCIIIFTFSHILAIHYILSFVISEGFLIILTHFASWVLILLLPSLTVSLSFLRPVLILLYCTSTHFPCLFIILETLFLLHPYRPPILNKFSDTFSLLAASFFILLLQKIVHSTIFSWLFFSYSFKIRLLYTVLISLQHYSSKSREH
jgi:hypothetical protein